MLWPLLLLIAAFTAERFEARAKARLAAAQVEVVCSEGKKRAAATVTAAELGVRAKWVGRLSWLLFVSAAITALLLMP